MAWYGLLIRGAGQIIFGMMAGYELKDVVGSYLGGSSFSSASAATSSRGIAGSGSKEMVVAVVSQDPNVWVVVGRTIGITLAILEAGRLVASALVSYEVRAHKKHFEQTREAAYRRIEEKNLGRSDSGPEGSAGGTLQNSLSWSSGSINPANYTKRTATRPEHH